MATYSETDKEALLRYPIPSILKHFGKRTDHAGQMYFSPFRDESVPSFHVDPRKNLWMDFGSGEGGSAHTLVTRLAACTKSHAWDILASLDPSVTVEDERAIHARQESSIVIDQISEPFTSTQMIEYARSRGIPQHILDRYCRQIRYHLGKNKTLIFNCIGFPTDEDGWVLRHTGSNARVQKRCTGCQVTCLDVGGRPAKGLTTSDRVEVFEGFFDFLSWLVIKDRTKPFSDICVLNSVNNIGRALPFIRAHKNVSCWLDNDSAGHRAFETISGECPQAVNRMSECPDAKDLNDFLKNRINATAGPVSRTNKPQQSIYPKF